MEVIHLDHWSPRHEVLGFRTYSISLIVGETWSYRGETDHVALSVLLAPLTPEVLLALGAPCLSFWDPPPHILQLGQMTGFFLRSFLAQGAGGYPADTLLSYECSRQTQLKMKPKAFFIFHTSDWAAANRQGFLQLVFTETHLVSWMET